MNTNKKLVGLIIMKILKWILLVIFGLFLICFSIGIFLSIPLILSKGAILHAVYMVSLPVIFISLYIAVMVKFFRKKDDTTKVMKVNKNRLIQ
jgi:hypothetical protein